MNGTLQNQYSKQQQTGESSTYGSELAVARIVVEMIMKYCFKLRMLGVPILGISVIYGDSIAVIINLSISGRNIKKKYFACSYHFIRETGVAGIVCFIYKPSKQNLANTLAKALPPYIHNNLMKTLISNKE